MSNNPRFNAAIPDANAIGVAIAAGMALAEPIPVKADGSMLAAIMPEGSSWKTLDLSDHLPHPTRKKGRMVLGTAQSFSDWVNRNRTDETIILTDMKQTSITAIFNGDIPGGPAGWRDHTALYACPLSDEWTRWMERSQHTNDVEHKKGMAHANFVQFIEDNLLDITEPASGAMLAMVRSFQAVKDVKFASAVRLDNGSVAFNYAETVDQQSTPGQLKMPEKFTITIPVFRDGQAYALDANLRYRIGQGAMVLWYELVRPEKALEHAFKNVVESVRTAVNPPRDDRIESAGKLTLPIPFFAV